MPDGAASCRIDLSQYATRMNSLCKAPGSMAGAWESPPGLATRKEGGAPSEEEIADVEGGADGEGADNDQHFLVLFGGQQAGEGVQEVAHTGLSMG